MEANNAMFSLPSYTTQVALKQFLGVVTVVHLKQNIVEVHIYGDQIKVTVKDDQGVYTDDCGVSTNVNMDDVNHPCSIEHIDKRERIRNTITDKLNIEDKL